MAEPTTTIELFFDVASAYSYLAVTQVAALEQRTGAKVSWRPFLLGGVFKATGNDMPARIPAKARYLMEDLDRWAKHYGVPVQVPSRFPQPTLRTQRALAHVERTAADLVGPFAIRLFDASWRDDRDVNADDVIADVATAAGLDGASVAAAIDLPETKDQLRKTTDEAVARGAFGAPTFYVGDAMFFGNDRMDLLAAHVLAGR